MTNKLNLIEGSGWSLIVDKKEFTHCFYCKKRLRKGEGFKYCYNRGKALCHSCDFLQKNVCKNYIRSNMEHIHYNVIEQRRQINKEST